MSKLADSIRKSVEALEKSQRVGKAVEGLAKAMTEADRLRKIKLPPRP
jgi:hypothetical protein